jgi:heme-degrading monooxygenase HmoA
LCSWKPFLELSGQREQKYLFYSYWDTEEDLENYRNSEFFNEVWTLRKIIQRQTWAWVFGLSSLS